MDRKVLAFVYTWQEIEEVKLNEMNSGFRRALEWGFWSNKDCELIINLLYAPGRLGKYKLPSNTLNILKHFLLHHFIDLEYSDTMIWRQRTPKSVFDLFSSEKHFQRFEKITNSPLDLELQQDPQTKLLEVVPTSWFTIYACQALRCDSPILEALFWTKPRPCRWYMMTEFNLYHNSRMEEVE